MDDMKQDWIDNMSISDLVKKYGLSRSSIYNKIKIFKEEVEEEEKRQKLIEERQLAIQKTLAEKEKIIAESKANGAIMKTDLSIAKIKEDDYLEKLFEQLDETESSLTIKQKRFAVLIAYGVKQTNAYAQAGYSNSKHISIRASELKRNPKIADAIMNLRRIVNEDLDTDPRDTVKFMKSIEQSDVMDFVDIGTEEVVRYTKQGDSYIINKPYMRLKEDLSHVDTKLIKSLKLNKEGNVELELYSKEMATNFFSRYHDMFNNTGKESDIESTMADNFESIDIEAIDADIDSPDDADIIDAENLNAGDE